MFISLDVGVLDALRAELEGRGVDVKEGQWGYRHMVIADSILVFCCLDPSITPKPPT